MKKEDIATLTLSEDKKTLFITSMNGASQQAYDTGSLLIDLLELDYDSFSMKYIMLTSILGSNRIADTNEFNIDAEENKYNDVKREFAEAAHICFDSDLSGKYKKIEKGNIQQRYSYYTLKLNPTFENDLEIDLRLATSCTPYINDKEISVRDWIEKIRDVKEENSADFILTTQPRFIDSYWFHSLADVMYFELMNVVKGNIVIKRCENCKRYFVPTGRIDALYCSRTAPGSQKTCVEIGAISKYEKCTKENPIKKAYRMEYKKRYAHVLKGKSPKNEFFTWVENMKVVRDEALKGEISYDNFIEKLKT
ncbi:MAG: hypothetical protein GXY17_02235 [Clostridiaceae bacterium]|nr:hypothetical protein [Clostridiaceae bacterium]